jgi:hypothetical protein
VSEDEEEVAVQNVVTLELPKVNHTNPCTFLILEGHGS